MRRIDMSKIKEVLRLKLLNQLSNRQIQTITGVSRNSVANYVNSFNEMNLSLEKTLREPLIINYQEHFSNLSRNFS